MPAVETTAILSHWAWPLAGAVIGVWLVHLCRALPATVLRRARQPLGEWVGPGGGVIGPVPPSRSIWVPIANALLWAAAALGMATPHPAAVLLHALLFSLLLLLALIDWDTTMLPDIVVLPLALIGLLATAIGLLPHPPLIALLSAALVGGLLGALAALYRKARGVRGIGQGDLKLLAALAIWLTLPDVLRVLLLASLLTIPWNLAWRHLAHPAPDAEWPFGPAIVLAALLWLLVLA